MNIEEIKKALNGSEYDFLRNEPMLGNNICLLTLGGSHSYGTDVDTVEHQSDIDLRGIYLNGYKEILSMNCEDKPFEDKDTDSTIYPFKQMIQLMISCNPNVLEMFGTKDEQLFILTPEGKLLRDNVNIFLSKKAYASFGGYAIQQMRRLENALARDSYSQPKKEKHILGSIEKQMMTFMDRYQEICEDELKLYLDDSTRQRYEKEIFIDISLKHYPLRDLKGMYNEMSQVINDYDKIGHRNNKKDEIHLLKHSMHLIRLLIMGTEVLSGHGINTCREKDRDLLLDIRNGMFTYEEIFSLVNQYEKDFKYAKDNCVLPDYPQYDKIEELMMQINKSIILKNI